MRHILIVGAGPAGVLLAHYLLRRDKSYCVHLYDRRPDPRTVSFSKSRTFPLTLCERGMNSLRQIEGIEAAVRELSVEVEGTVFHQHNGKTRYTPRNKPLLCLDRTNLVIVLLDKLTELHDESRLQLHFNCQCTYVDRGNKTVNFQVTTSDDANEQSNEFTAPYDLLVGADGARSIVRTHLLNSESFEFEQQYVRSDYKSVFLSSAAEQPDIELKPNCIHTWRLEDGTVVLAVHQRDGTLNGVIHFPRERNQIAELLIPDAVRQFFQKHFPEAAQFMSEREIRDFAERSTSSVLTVRCSRYHDRDDVLIIGDAAHAVSPSLGQGCNAAFEDVLVFDRLLDEYADDIAQAIAQFSMRRKPDAHALADLSNYSFPLARSMFIQFVLRESITKVLHRLLPKQIPSSLFTLVSETNVPYSQIKHAHQGWLDAVKRSNERFLKR
ncbi:MAG: FAD-dependent monooxygenase [Cyanobacteria bacterium RU_5_0]|nr:FAD-dependent monooxygenase [Cyanobacteria bacterium RU_5_0]